MNTILSLASVAFAALAIYLSQKSQTDPPPERNGFLTFLGLTALLIVVSALAAPRDLLLPVSAALSLGFVGAALSAWFRASGLPGLLVGVAAGSLCGYFPEAAFLCLVTLGIGALVLSSEGAAYASLGAAVVLAANALGPRAGDAPALAVVGTIVALGVAVAGLVVLALKESKTAWLRPVVMAALAAIAGVLLVGNYLKLDDDRLPIVAAALSALVVHWLLSDSEDSLRIGFAAVIWVGLGIVAFGLGRGVGMSLALLTASAVLATLRSRAGLLSMTPLIGLVLYRVLRDAQPVSPPALEATQYNALVGLTIGVVLPLLPTDWLTMELPSSKRTAGLALWAILLVAVPITALIVTGPRGVVGIVVGLGMAGLLLALKRVGTLVPLGLIVGLAGAVLGSYGWFRHLLVIERDEKIRLLAIIAIAFVALGLGLAAITPRVQKEVAR